MKSLLVFVVTALMVTCWSGSAPAFLYSVDDGSHEEVIGLSGGGNLTWMNQFFQTPGADTINRVLVAWGDIPDGTPGTVSIWSDPSGTGNPAGRVLLTSRSVTVINSNTDIFNAYCITPTTVPGSFFVGIEMTIADLQWPASLDTTSTYMSSWIGALDSGLPFDLIDNYGFAGNWLIRAEAVPEPSTFLLLGAGLGGLALLRRRK